jgi:hypothetical protein
MPLAKASRLEPCEIVLPTGVGGTGEVYRAIPAPEAAQVPFMVVLNWQTALLQ